LESGQDTQPSRRCEPPLPHKLAQRLPPAAVEAILDGYRHGRTTIELAEDFNISATSVKTLLHANGVPIRDRRALTAKQTIEAVRLYELGWSPAKIATKLGVSDETARRQLTACGVVTRPAYRRRRSESAARLGCPATASPCSARLKPSDQLLSSLCSRSFDSPSLPRRSVPLKSDSCAARRAPLAHGCSAQRWGRKHARSGHHAPPG